MNSAEDGLLRPLTYQDRHTLIQERLKDYIVQNKLKPGDKLPTEETLSEQLGVSRTAVREALRGLEALGIVESQHGVGRVVRPFSFAPTLENLSYALVFYNYSVLHITEIRKALDAYFVEQAMANLTGGCPWGYGGGVATIAYPYVTMANPYDPYTIMGRYPTIPSWMWALPTPTSNG